MIYSWEQLKERCLNLGEISEKIMVFDNPEEIKLYNSDKTRYLLTFKEDFSVLDFQQNFIKNLTYNEMYQLIGLLK